MTEADMTQPDWNDDDALLADLAAALREVAPLDAAVRERGRAAFSWRTVDDELMLLQLSYDSFEASVDDAVFDLATATRTAASPRDEDGDAPRVLIFDAEGISVELEVSGDRIAGQILPPAAGRVLIEAQDDQVGTVSADADDLGFFVLPALAPGWIRLRCETSTAQLVTEWVRF